MGQLEQRGNELEAQSAGRVKSQETSQHQKKRQVRDRVGCGPGAGGTEATEKGSRI